MKAFCNRSIWTVDMSRCQQWTQYLSSIIVRNMWGDPDQKSRWCNADLNYHMARIPDWRIAKKTFRLLPQPRPFSGLEEDGETLYNETSKMLRVSEEKWYENATISREDCSAICLLYTEWQKSHHTNIPWPSNYNKLHDLHTRVQSREEKESDRARHKWIEDRNPSETHQPTERACPIPKS